MMKVKAFYIPLAFAMLIGVAKAGESRIYNQIYLLRAGGGLSFLANTAEEAAKLSDANLTRAATVRAHLLCKSLDANNTFASRYWTTYMQSSQYNDFWHKQEPISNDLLMVKDDLNYSKVSDRGYESNSTIYNTRHFTAIECVQ